MESTATSADDAQTLADRVETLKSSLSEGCLEGGENFDSPTSISSSRREGKFRILPCFLSAAPEPILGNRGILRLIIFAQPFSRQLMDLARGFETIEADRDSLLAERARLLGIVISFRIFFSLISSLQCSSKTMLPTLQPKKMKLLRALPRSQSKNSKPSKRNLLRGSRPLRRSRPRP